MSTANHPDLLATCVAAFLLVSCESAPSTGQPDGFADAIALPVPVDLDPDPHVLEIELRDRVPRSRAASRPHILDHADAGMMGMVELRR